MSLKYKHQFISEELYTLTTADKCGLGAVCVWVHVCVCVCVCVCEGEGEGFK